MTKVFNISVTGLEKVFDMPDTWTEEDYRGLAHQLEVEDIDDISGSDLLEMVLMALQDLEPREAADAVLAYKLPTSTKPGVRQNIVQDLLEDQRPWEEAADIKLHAGIFAAAVLLQKAFPKSFSRPDMLHLTMQLTGSLPESSGILSNPPEAAFVTRILADAMNENSILERLYEEQLASNDFPDAEYIIWQAEFSAQSLGELSSAVLSVYSSAHWLDAMEEVSDFQSNAYNDSPDDEKAD